MKFRLYIFWGSFTCMRKYICIKNSIFMSVINKDGRHWEPCISKQNIPIFVTPWFFGLKQQCTHLKCLRSVSVINCLYPQYTNTSVALHICIRVFIQVSVYSCINLLLIQCLYSLWLDWYHDKETPTSHFRKRYIDLKI